jgi:hypothetical protein
MISDKSMRNVLHAAGVVRTAKARGKKPKNADRRLPPDPEEMNDDRAAWAGECISLMSEITGCEDGQEAAGDLLANYFHWCDRNGLDMEMMIERARACYRDETMAFPDAG